MEAVTKKLCYGFWNNISNFRYTNVQEVFPRNIKKNLFKCGQIIDFKFAEISNNGMRPINLHFLMTTDKILDLSKASLQNRHDCNETYA